MERPTAGTIKSYRKHVLSLALGAILAFIIFIACLKSNSMTVPSYVRTAINSFNAQSTISNAHLPNDADTTSIRRKPVTPFSGTPLHPTELNARFSSALWSHGCPNEKRMKRKACLKPRQKILFVKVHKCAGTTFSSLLLRFAKRNELKVALPRFNNAHIGYPKFYRPHYVLDYDANANYDILANHVIYDRCYVQRDFPIEKTVYVTILRDPWKQLVSVVNYYTLPGFPPPKPYFTNLLNQPRKYAVPIRFLEPPDFKATKNLVRNDMVGDLGFPQSQSRNQSAIKQFIRTLEKDFDLIMIVEFYYESLILFKRLMCWQWKDILFIRLNQKRSTRADQETITEDMILKHTQIDNVDYAVYNHFKGLLQKKIENQGASFQREVKLFAAMTDKVIQFCAKKKSDSEKLVLERNEFMSDALVVTKELCQEMRKTPTDLVKEMKQKKWFFGFG